MSRCWKTRVYPEAEKRKKNFICQMTSFEACQADFEELLPGHCYNVSENGFQTSWNGAVSACASLDAEIAFIYTEEEHSAIKEMLIR